MSRKIRILLIVALFMLQGLVDAASASDFLFYKELNFIGGYSNQRRWIGKSETLSNSAGFEHYGKFSSKYGDYLTTDLQVRLAYDSTASADDAWACEIHNAWAEYRANNELKIRAGHFAPAFGLEPVVDTHSTILQTLIMRDIGYDKDWGGELRGSFPAFDYEAAFQIGSGMSIRRQDSSYLVTGRIGTPQAQDFRYGISGMIGNVLKTLGMSTFPKNHLLSGNAVFKERVGLDCQYNWTSFLLKAEVAYGRDDNKNVIGYLGEVDYTAPRNQNWSLETQIQSFVNDLGRNGTDDSTFSMSLTYRLSQQITLRAAFIDDLNMFTDKKDTKVLLQLYYYAL